MTQGLSYAIHKVTLSSQFTVDVSSGTCSIQDLHVCFLRPALKRLLPNICTYSVHFMVISASNVGLRTSSISFWITSKANTYSSQCCVFCTSWSTTLASWVADVCIGDGANVKLYRHASLWYRFSSQHLQPWNVVVHKKSKNQLMKDELAHLLCTDGRKLHTNPADLVSFCCLYYRHTEVERKCTTLTYSVN